MIKIADVNHRYPDRWGRGSGLEVLQNIDLTIEERTFVSLLGPSGCGKTTLLRMIDGLVVPEQGAIEILGRPVNAPSADCAMVFQEFNLFPWRNVLENVEFPLEIAKVPKAERRERSLAVIDRVGLTSFAHSYPQELSGGMKQRVGLARALVCGQPYLLMDEPFGALDPQIRELLQIDLLKTLESSEQTVVFVTHDLSEAIFLSDRIAVFSARPGRIKAEIMVDFPRPRWQHAAAIRDSEEFTRIRRELWTLLMPEVSVEV
jgi:NitT/TauT family transport system ATP-binding protein